ncbi:MAG: DUF3047 domain-containing protein [Nitrospira sp.]|nr:DUF3047 domain-containing protein [Nitrospira sp.]
MQRWLVSLTASLILISASGMTDSQVEMIPVGVFTGDHEADGLPKGWRPFTFRKIPAHTQYRLEEDVDRFVVKAESQASASMIYKEVNADPKTYPMLRWEWKVLNLLRKGDPTKKSGDDYPARVYVTFRDRTGINYIWESKFPKGRILPNPYVSDVKMFIVESGPEQIGQWVKEERNLYEDYKRAFGREPAWVVALSLMTDTDNTGEAAVAYYADITLAKR